MIGGQVEDEEVERLVAELRGMLRETGFGWAAEQAEAALPPDSSVRTVAHALVDAAETVTVDLAEVEIASLRQLGVEEIVLKVDPGAEEGDADGGDNRVPGSKAIAFDESSWLRGQQRRAALDALPGYAKVFAELRGRLNGLG